MSMFEDNSFDAVIETYVLCTVNDVSETLQEVKRVLKPGSSFFFLDHVRAPSGTWMRLVQDLMSNSGFWPFVGDGCYLNRDIRSSVERAGFARVDATDFTAAIILKYHVFGIAKK